RDELFLDLIVGRSGGIAGAILQTVGPAVIGRAVGAVSERPAFGRAGGRTVGIGIGVGGGVGDHIRDRDAERLVHLVRHVVAGDEPAAGGMAGNDDGFQVGEVLLARKLA